MLIYRCDRCQAETRIEQIVGHEFDYLKHNFASLVSPVGKMRDLCGPCYKIAQDAILEHRRAQVDYDTALARALARQDS